MHGIEVWKFFVADAWWRLVTPGPEQRLGVLWTTGQVWRDAYRGVRQSLPLLIMPLAVNVLTAKMFAYFAAMHFGQDPDDALTMIAINVVVAALQALTFAPLAIAIHRMVLTPQARTRFGAGFVREAKYAALLMLLAVLMFGLGLFGAAGFNRLMMHGIRFNVAQLVLCGCALLFFQVPRFFMLLAAVAIGSKGLRGYQILKTTKGHVLRIFAVFALNEMLVLAGFLAMTAMVALTVKAGLKGNFLVESLFFFTVLTVQVSVIAALASRIYLAYAGVSIGDADAIVAVAV